MAKISNLFREKVYIFNKPREVFESEKEIISLIFKDLDFKIKSIDFVDANLHNDLFKINTDYANFYLKFSLEKDSKIFKESNFLWLNFHNQIVPKICKEGELKEFNNLKYNIISSMEIENLREAGISECFVNEGSIPYFLNQMSKLNIDTIKNETITDYLKFYLEFDILKVPDVQFDSLESSPIIKNLVKKQVVVLQNILKEKLTQINFKTDDFCHGNLNPSTILCNGDFLKCINFENAYAGDFLFEILNLKYELFYDHSIENNIIEIFNKIANKPLDLSKLKEYREFSCYFNLLKICVDYLQQVFILKSQRQDKILNLAIKFSKNYENFYQLPDFEKNFKPIAELFVESVI